MSHESFCLISGTIFSLVAIGHLSRLALGWPVQIGPAVIPMWVSWLGLIVPAALAAWAFRLARAARAGG